MLKHIRVNNYPCQIKWSPDEVCDLFIHKSISADQLIQENKTSTHKLIRDLYLLACQAALSNPMKKSKEAEILRTYAQSIKETSEIYDNLFNLGEWSC